jgi:hypothetical protein
MAPSIRAEFKESMLADFTDAAEFSVLTDSVTELVGFMLIAILETFLIEEQCDNECRADYFNSSSACRAPDSFNI